MADITSILLLFALNSIIFGTIIWVYLRVIEKVWVYLRVIEKALDVTLKWRQVEKKEG